MSLIELKDVCKEYKSGKIRNSVLNNINLTIEKGEIIVILGPSGSGKTTLLNVISGLDRISSGKIMYDGKNISKYSDIRMTRFRKKRLGFIFQTYNLLEHLNVYENVLVGSSLGKKNVDIDKIIDTVGLLKHKKKYMYQLSGGEQQRVSIARALAKMPDVMFCDEPTGALDEKTGKIVLKSLVDANNKLKTTMIIVTHNPSIAYMADTVIRMNSGEILEISKNKKKLDALDLRWA